MKTQQKLSRQSGFTLIELFVVLAVIFVGVTIVVGNTKPAQADSKEQQYISGFTSIISKARSKAKGMPDGYASITIEDLVDEEYLPQSFGDGSGTNPDGGDWDLSSSTVNQLIVRATGSQSAICERVAALYAQETTASCSSDTISVTSN